MKYPYIGQCYSAMILFYEEGEGLVLDDALGLDDNTKIGDKVTLHGGTDITHEYLANTYGEVVSPEHAEFIVELAENAGFGVSGLTARSMCFEFSGDCNVVFYEIPVDIFANNEESKKTTIPLPPKADKQESSWWPVLGSKVITSDEVGYVRLMPDSKGYYVIEVDGEYSQLTIEEFEKPKTPEEEFAGELIKKYKHLPNHEQAFSIARDVIDNALAKVKKV